MWNLWGGSLSASADESVDDPRKCMGITRLSLKKQEEADKSWLLHSTQDRKKKYMDFGCVLCTTKLFATIVYVLFISALIIAGTAIAIVKLTPKHHPAPPPLDDYTLALQQALLFFDAQKSGNLPHNYSIPYRRSSGLDDGPSLQTKGPPLLVGGYYDSGINIKFGFPAAFTMTLLSWSVIEYGAKYDAIGELQHVKEIIKWGVDYLLNTFDGSAHTVNSIYAQVGKGEGGDANTPNDNYCWQRPEDMKYPRPVAECSSAPELAAETAAALAAASIVFRNDKNYSDTLILGAKKVFNFSIDNGKQTPYTESGSSDASHFYPSSGFHADQIWGATWLFFASGDWNYLSFATQKVQLYNYSSGITNLLDYDNKTVGIEVLMTRLRILRDPGNPYEDALKKYHADINSAVCSYQQAWKTPGQLAYYRRKHPAPFRYTTTAAFVAALYGDYLKAADIAGWNCGSTFYSSQMLRDFARSQINYILGKNPLGMSYLAGFGKNFPKFIHHRAASIPQDGKYYGCTQGYKWRETKKPNPNVLKGAMVGGPDEEDMFYDSRSKANFTEPTIASNAALVAALIALVGEGPDGVGSSSVDTTTIFSAITSPQG